MSFIQQNDTTPLQFGYTTELQHPLPCSTFQSAVTCIPTGSFLLLSENVPVQKLNRSLNANSEKLNILHRNRETTRHADSHTDIDDINNIYSQENSLHKSSEISQSESDSEQIDSSEKKLRAVLTKEQKIKLLDEC